MMNANSSLCHNPMFVTVQIHQFMCAFSELSVHMISVFQCCYFMGSRDDQLVEMLCGSDKLQGFSLAATI